MFNFTPFFAGFPSRALHRRIIYPGLSTWLSNLSAWKRIVVLSPRTFAVFHLRVRPSVTALLVEGAFSNQRFGNPLRARSDDPEAFAAGRRYGRSVQSGRSGLRGYVACQTRRSDRCQTPCSGAQKGSHEIYRGITLHLEQGGRITIFTVTFYIHPDIRVCNWES